ncbi:MAG: hypothetical protein JO232_24030 [Verrucomicrobia bacterium]|nr:hypothetical protein [Verrucomicrobiota bacterium]
MRLAEPALVGLIVTVWLLNAGCQTGAERLHVSAPAGSKILNPTDIGTVLSTIDEIANAYGLHRVSRVSSLHLREYSESTNGYPVVLAVYQDRDPSYVAIGIGGTYKDVMSVRIKRALEERFGKGRVYWVSELIFNPV